MGSYEWLTPTKLPSSTKTPTSYKGSTCPLQITLLAGNQVFTCEPVATVHIQTIMLDLAFCLKWLSRTMCLPCKLCLFWQNQAAPKVTQVGRQDQVHIGTKDILRFSKLSFKIFLLCSSQDRCWEHFLIPINDRSIQCPPIPSGALKL